MPNKITILRHNESLNKFCIRKVGEAQKINEMGIEADVVFVPLWDLMTLKRVAHSLCHHLFFTGDRDVGALQLYPLHWLQHHHWHQQVL